MPYNPGVQDNSGQLLAQGLQQGIASLAQGLERNFQERKKKEDEKKAKEAVMQAGKGLFGDAFDLKDAPQDQWGKIIQLNQHIQQEPMRQLQMENAALRNKIDVGQINAMAQAAAQQQRNQAALSSAFNPTADTAAAIQGGAGFENLPRAGATDPMSAVMRAGRGGADAATLAHLAAMSENLAQSQQRMTPRPERMPVAMTVGDQSGVWDGANWKPNAAPKAAPIDRSLTAELMKLDAAAKQAEATGDLALAATLRQAMQSQAKRGGGTEDLIAGIAALAGGKAAAPAAATTSTPAVTKGTRARQGGKVYEFDGKNWNEVK